MAGSANPFDLIRNYSIFDWTGRQQDLCNGGESRRINRFFLLFFHPAVREKVAWLSGFFMKKAFAGCPAANDPEKSVLKD